MRNHTNSGWTGRSAVSSLVALGLLSAVAGTTQAQVAPVITVAVPPAGTSGHLMANGWSKVVTGHGGIKKVVLQSFSSASAWPVRMNKGEVSFAQHCGFEQIKQAYRGEGPFGKQGPQKNLRTVLTGYGFAWGVHVIDPAIKSAADLKGRKIFVQVSHADHVTALKVMLKSAGVGYGSDMTVIPYRSPREAIQGLMTGRGDGMAFGAIPGLVRVKQAKGLHTVPIPTAVAKMIQAEDPVWGVTTMKKGTGPLKPASDTPVLKIQCGIAAAAATSADTVYQLMTAIFDKHAKWKGVHPLARQWNVKRATEVIVAPVHEGAIRFFKERGVWTPALEARNKALM